VAKFIHYLQLFSINLSVAIFVTLFVVTLILTLTGTIFPIHCRMKILLAGATVISSYEREIQVKKRMPTLAVVSKDMFIKTAFYCK